MSPRQIVARGFLTGVLAALLGGGAFLLYVAWYTGTERILPGVTVGRTPVGGLTVRQARQRINGTAMRRPPVLTGGVAGGNPVGGTGGVEPQAARPAEESGTARVRWQDQTWALRLSDAAGRPDVQGALRSARALGRSGTVWERAKFFLVGLVHGHHVAVEPVLGDEELARQMEAIAREVHRPAEDAHYDFETDTISGAVAGQALDVGASLKAVQDAVRQGRHEANLVVKPVPPAVGREDVASAKQYELARFTTPILAADPGRVQNISIAVRKISGVVLKPGQIFSFNDIVGPRDAEHGWAQAKELYQGEFVLGYGGGICQVSSTLYNSVLLAGLEIKERYHHDRPLQYVDPGRDATVAWNVLDYKFRNSTDVPVLIGARILPGAPQQIEVALYGPQPVPPGHIALEAADVRYMPPEMEEILDPSLPAGVREVIDEGHYGMEVTTYRVFRDGGRERREKVSTDQYRPKAGRVKVGVGNAPGSDRLLEPGVR